jgi:Fe-S-cluster containining protein
MAKKEQGVDLTKLNFGPAPLTTPDPPADPPADPPTNLPDGSLLDTFHRQDSPPPPPPKPDPTIGVDPNPSADIDRLPSEGNLSEEDRSPEADNPLVKRRQLLQEQRRIAESANEEKRRPSRTKLAEDEEARPKKMPGVSIPSKNKVPAQSKLERRFDPNRVKRNQLGLTVDKESDNCFHLNASWRGGVCVLFGNKPCPFLGGNQPSCETYQEKPVKK